MDKKGDLPQDDPIARGKREEPEVHQLAKTMMLHDLRGYLNDWEEGKFTWLDINTVSHLLENILNNWKHYEDAAKAKDDPEQLLLFPEDDGSVRVNF